MREVHGLEYQVQVTVEAQLCTFTWSQEAVKPPRLGSWLMHWIVLIKLWPPDMMSWPGTASWLLVITSGSTLLSRCTSTIVSSL